MKAYMLDLRERVFTCANTDRDASHAHINHSIFHGDILRTCCTTQPDSY